MERPLETPQLRTEPTTARPVTAVALDGGVDLDRAAKSLDRWRERRRHPYGSVFELPDDDRRLYLFEFGAVVIFGPADLQRFPMEEVESATGRRLLGRTAETWFLHEDPSHDPKALRVGWDRVVVRELTPRLEAAMALLFGQSAALERFEKESDDLVEQALVLARELERLGRPSGPPKELVRRIGRITADRLAMTSWFYLVDRPEETWEDAEVAELYDALFSNLELAGRHRAMLHKLEAVEAATQSIADISMGRRSYFLEWAIVLLIVFEIVITLIEKLL